MYTPSSSAVSIAYDAEEMDDYTYIFSDILARKMNVLIYAGEFDERDGPKTIEPWIRNVNYIKENPNFWTQSRSTYYVKDVDGS